MKLVIFSICYNEAKTIGQLLDRMPKSIKGISEIETWVIDDGSTDDTAKIAAEHGAKVLSDGANKKLAFRFREALNIALKHKADIMVNIDGDLQFDPADIPKLVAPIINDEADFVAADRFTNPDDNKSHRPNNMPLAKYLGNKFGAKVVSRLSNHQFNDVTCGFRAYNRRALYSLNTDGTYTYTQESFQVLAMKRLRIIAMPTHVNYYKGRRSRVVTGVVSYISQSAVGILRSYRDFAPLRFFGWLGLLPFSLGFISTTIFVGHWLIRGQFSPYKFLGFAGIYFITIALMIWALGLVADMLSRILNNQEKTLENIKELRWPADESKK